MTDYKTLLKKYMQHVGECEGRDFLDNIGSYMSDVDFTEDEAAALRNTSYELWGEDY
jgi:hypothetical protein